MSKIKKEQFPYASLNVLGLTSSMIEDLPESATIACNHSQANLFSTCHPEKLPYIPPETRIIDVESCFCSLSIKKMSVISPNVDIYEEPVVPDVYF